MHVERLQTLTIAVVGDKGKKIVIHDEGKFDPRSIPLKSWNEHEYVLTTTLGFD